MTTQSRNPNASARLRIVSLAAASMLAFAANSLLCRFALKTVGMDAASFTGIRLLCGAAVLAAIMLMRRIPVRAAGNWLSALALFVYAATFSLAYTRLSAGVGTLILFGSVQASMIGYGLWAGERLIVWQVIGLCVALGGLLSLLLPGLSAPPLGGAAMIACAGAAWGTYSLRGKQARDPVAATAGNFLRSMPFAVVFSIAMSRHFAAPMLGIGCAVLSGGVTSGLGYILWYNVIRELTATHAAAIQLSVPVLAALGGVGLLGEPLTWRLAICSAAILGGVALVILTRKTLAPQRHSSE